MPLEGLGKIGKKINDIYNGSKQIAIRSLKIVTVVCHEAALAT
jgi:hypothetical protein